METIFPADDGYKGIFFIGFRKETDNPTKTERVGTVVLKRTYDIAAEAGRLTPSTDAQDIFFQDQMDMADHHDNLVVNGDFESADENGRPTQWMERDGVVIKQYQDPTDSKKHYLEITGSAHGCAFQAMTLPWPLGGRKFALRLNAKSDQPTTVNAWLEAGSEKICMITAQLGTDFRGTNKGLFSAFGKWPKNITTNEMKVVLEMASDGDRTVYYDDVSVHSLIRYEHDMFPFKPEGDVIVLDCTGTTGQSTIKVNDTPWLTRTIESVKEPDLFGWEPRESITRKNEAGAFSDKPADYPPEWPVPAENPNKDPLTKGPPAFNNRFFNGYLRNAGIPTRVPHLPAGAHVGIERNGSIDYAFQLNNEAISAVYNYYTGVGADESSNWQSVPVTMNIDTVVIEPERNRCYLVWRGIWNYDVQHEKNYRRLVISATA